jgi:uncharacterized protein YjdB
MSRILVKVLISVICFAGISLTGCDNLLTAGKKNKVTVLAGNKELDKAAINNFDIVETINVPENIITLTVGESKVIDASVNYLNGRTDKLFELKVPDDNIIVVSGNGAVTALKEGQSFLKISAKKEPDKYSFIPVIVKNPPVTVKSISLRPSYINIKQDSSQVLNTTVSMTDKSTDNRVRWVSLNRNIAEVDSTGRITTKNTGKTKIEALFLDDITKKTAIPVIVTAPGETFFFETPRVQSINVSHSNILMAVNSSKEVEATVSYDYKIADQDIIWQSSAPDIVEVSEKGVLKALKEGSSVITAVAGADKDKNVNISVLVQKFPIRPVSVAITPVFTHLKANESINFSATVTNTDSSTGNNISWISQDTAIAGISPDGKVNALKEGIVKIEAISNIDNQVKSTALLMIDKADKKEPAAPILNQPVISGKNDNYSVKLNWTKINDAVKYNIYRDHRLITSVETNSWTADNLATKTAIFQIVSCNKQACSEMSNIRPVKSPVLETAPVLNEAEVLGSSTSYSASLKWSAVTGATWYQVYKNDKTVSAKVTANSWTDLNLSAPEYTYTVGACNDSGCSVPGNKVIVGQPAPAAPVFSDTLNFKNNSLNTILIKWSPVTGANRYKIYRDGKLLNIISAISFNDRSLPDSSYNYYVSACNNSGCSGFSKENIVNTLAKPVSPELDSPYVSITPNSNSVLLEWSKVENSYYYNVYRDSQLIYTGNATYWEDNDLQNIEHYYYVESCNAIYCSESDTVKSLK